MNLTFRIRFATRAGQSLWLAGDWPREMERGLSRGKPFAAGCRCNTATANRGNSRFPLPAAATKKPLNYSYILRNPDGAQTTDWGRDRDLIPAELQLRGTAGH